MATALKRPVIPSSGWDGTKAHEAQTWLKLSFRDDGALLPLAWTDNVTLDILVPQP